MPRLSRAVKGVKMGDKKQKNYEGRRFDGEIDYDRENLNFLFHNLDLIARELYNEAYRVRGNRACGTYDMIEKRFYYTTIDQALSGVNKAIAYMKLLVPEMDDAALEIFDQVNELSRG